MSLVFLSDPTLWTHYKQYCVFFWAIRKLEQEGFNSKLNLLASRDETEVTVYHATHSNPTFLTLLEGVLRCKSIPFVASSFTKTFFLCSLVMNSDKCDWVIWSLIFLAIFTFFFSFFNLGNKIGKSLLSC